MQALAKDAGGKVSIAPRSLGNTTMFRISSFSTMGF
jgi:hypothetical protein